MNHVYRVIFNAQLGLWQAVCECARTAGKRSSRSISPPTTAEAAGPASPKSRMLGWQVLAVSALWAAALPAQADMYTQELTSGVVNAPIAGSNGGNGTATTGGTGSASGDATYANNGGNYSSTSTAGQGANGSGGSAGAVFSSGSPVVLGGLGGDGSGGGGGGGTGILVSGIYQAAASGKGGVDLYFNDGAGGAGGSLLTQGQGGGGGANTYYGGGGGGGGGVALHVTGGSVQIDAALRGGSGGDKYATAGGGSGAGGGGAGLFAEARSSISIQTSSSIYGGTGGSAVAYSGGGGAAIVGYNYSLDNQGIIIGGTGGNDAIGGGGGGAGVSGQGFTLLNHQGASITGGDGGTGYLSSRGGGMDAPAMGGAGVASLGGATIVTSASISGGLSGIQKNALTRPRLQASAVYFAGGGNSLELQDGYSFIGSVVSSSGVGASAINGGDTLKLGGTTSPATNFDLSQLGAANSTAQYQGFDHYAKTGTSTWVATGAQSVPGDWTIDSGGTLQLGSGAQTASLGSVAVVNNGTLAFNSSSDMTASNAISGSGSLQQNGSGTTTLTDANTYTGGTTINAGMLALGSGGSLSPTSAVTLVNSGSTFDISAAGNQTIGALSGALGSKVQLGANTLTFGDASDQTIGSVIADGSLGGGLIKAGSGTSTLTASNTYTGGTTINAGTLSINSEANLGNTSGSLTLNGGTLQVTGTGLSSSSRAISLGANGAGLDITDADNNFTINQSLSGAGSLSKLGSGTLTITGPNTYTGGTTINAGTLALGAGGSLSPTSAVTLANSGTTFDLSTGDPAVTMGALSGVAGSTVSLGGTSLLFGDASNRTFAGVVTGTGSMIKAGSGTTTFTGNNTYSGATAIGGGTWQAGAVNAMSSASTVGLLPGATFNLNSFNQSIGSLSGGGNVILGSATLTTGGDNTSTSFGGVISGAGGLTKNGAGTQTLTSANSYTGGTTINAGTLALGTGGSLSQTGAVNLANGGVTFDISAGGNQTIGALSGALGSNVQLGANTLTFGNASDQTIGSVIADGSLGGGLIKAGSGTSTLTASNTYTGGTTINAGTLAINGSVAGNVQVNSGSTLGGSGRIGGNVMVGSGATLSPGNSPGTLTIGGNLTLGNSSTTVFQLGQSGAAGGVSNDLVNVGGNLAVGGTLNATAASAGWYRLFNYGQNTALATPGVLSGQFATQNISSSQAGFNVASAQLSSTAATSTTAGQVNLSVLGTNQKLQFWQGAGSPGNVWDGFTANWVDTNPASTPATTTQNSVAVFGTDAGATPGAITVQGPQSFDTLQFSANGYSLVADTSNPGSLAIAPGTGSGATINTDAGISASIAAPITNGGAGGAGNALNKVGGGTLTLSGNNTYTGGTAINQGTLVASSNSALGTGAATVDNSANNAATLQVNTGVALSNAITVNNGGTLDNRGTINGLLTGTTGAANIKNSAGGKIGDLPFSGDAVNLSNGGTVTNDGSGSSIGSMVASTGVHIGSGGAALDSRQVSNSNQAIITGSSAGVLIEGANGSVMNLSGASIKGGILGTGVVMTQGGSVTNDGAGSAISGVFAAVSIGGQSGYVTNTGGGTITGKWDGLQLQAGGSVINDGAGSAISGSLSGVNIQNGAGTVTNSNGARINSAGNGIFGVNLDTGGTVTNNAGASIYGNVNSVQATGATTLTNAGLLSGNVTLDGTVANQVTLVAGGTLTGDLNIGSNTASTLTLDGAAPASLYSTAVTGATTFAGALVKNGTGTWTLDQDLAHANTSINAGTLQIGNGGTAGSLGTGAVVNNGTLALNRSDSITVANDISGTGALNQTGSGTTVLTGSNTYSGPTTITAGTLQVGNGGTAGSLGTGAVVNNSTFALDRSDSSTVANDISGTGALNQTGSGASVLTGSNTYSGPTTITAGTLQVGNGGTAGSLGTGAVVNSSTLALNRSDSSTVANDISGTGALNQTGSGTSVLTGSNIYSGPTTITAGTLQVGNGGTAGTLGTGAVVNNSTLALNRSDSSTIANDISGTGALNQTGSGTSVLTGSNTYSGPTTITAGTLQVGNGGTAGSLGTGAVVNNSTLALNRSDSITVANDISGTGALNQTGSGTSVLTGSNTYSGPTTITAGTLQVGNGGTAGTLGTGAVVNNSTLALNRSDSSSVANDISGTGALNQTGSGTSVLTGSNTYSGPTTITAGTLQVGNGGTVGSLGSGPVVNNALLAVNRSDSLAVVGDISGTGSLLQQGAGTTTLTGTNSFTGGTLVAAGTLQAGSAGALPQNTAYVLNQGATLDLNSHALQTSLLMGSGNVQLGSANLSVSNTAGQRDNFSGQIQGSGALVKQGAGTLALNGASSFTGGVNLKQGRIDLGNAQGLGTGTLSMDDGTAIGLTTNGMAVANNLHMTGSNDPIIDTGANSSTWAGAITGAGFLTKQGTGTLTLTSAGNTYTGATEVAQGTLQAGAVNTLSSASNHTVDSGATLNLAGFSQTIAGLTNSGTVNLSTATSGTTPGTTLKVTGPYVGNGGTLGLSTVLAADGSATDKLLLSGPAAVASGNTTVQITNADGLGAQTRGTGIQVITTENGGSLQPGAFTLAGGHVDAGAFEYHLFQTAQGAALQSINTQLAYRAEVPLISALPAQLRQSDMAMLGDLRKRMGDDVAQGNTTGTVSNDAGYGRRAWGRILRTDPTITQQGTVNPQSSGHLTGFQAGLDLYADQNVNAGVYVGQMQGDMSVTGFASGINNKYVGFNSLTTRYLGLYGTWQNASGMYADAVLQGADYRSNLHTAGNTSSATTNGSGWLASVEMGKAFAISSNWQIEPQAQIIYRSINLHDTAMSLANVQNKADNDWTLRLGARIKGSFATSAGVLQPYGRINIYKASNTNDVASFVVPAATTDISAKGGYTSTELAAGATLQLNNTTSLYGELGKLWANGGSSQVKSGVQASLGVRVRW